ncbi:MAG: cupin domain-containing protein [Elusimicrobia bacterium]|nr:cupin domain-containing protein [Elusimicrobiota bacterium]
MAQGQQKTEDMKGRALDAAGLTDYQDGAVVSRALIQKPTGSVTLFSFAQGQGLSEHTAPFDALVLVLDGEAEIRIAGTPRQVKAGQLIIMPAGKPHALQAVKPFKMALVMIRS